MQKKSCIVVILFLQILCANETFAALTAMTTNANCTNNGSITLSSNNGTVSSFSYSGANSGVAVGNTVNLSAGIYSVTATLSSGNIETQSNVVVDHADHIQLKNWYMTGNIPAASVNWGATLDDPLMIGWTGITTNSNGCITAIDLSDKNIIGAVPNFNLPNLQTLALPLNQLSGSIPNFNLPNLKLIELSNNQLTGTIPNFNLPNLESLHLPYNQLSGNIPNFNLPNLKTLLLYGNQLSGTIPNLNLPNLEILALFSNQLSGTIPNFNLQNLQYLDLSDNQLTGSIPNFNLANLTDLYIGVNQLTGTIPNFNLPNLIGFDCSLNQIGGTIPNFNQPNLQNIWLSDNQLTGTIPNFNLQSLFTLSLSNNQLTGTIPNFSTTNLEYLYLDYNLLSGNIPAFNLSNLRQLYLNNNQLSGCIPLQIKYNCPLIEATGGNISNNTALNTQVWADYWNSSIGACPASVLNAKVLLQNATNGLISSYLSSLNTFPQIDPYTVSPLNANFTHVNNPTVAQIAPIALTITGNDTIVDWIFLELRTGTSGSSTVAYTKTALLQADGDIVGMNGRSPVVFENAMPGNYFVAVRHRNHLGFRTANKLTLSTSPTPFDFTNNSIPLYGAFPTVAIGQNQFAMCSGDANSDGSIDAFDTIDWEIQNGLFDDYTLNSDYNMDGSVDAFDSIFWELNNGKFQELE